MKTSCSIAVLLAVASAWVEGALGSQDSYQIRERDAHSRTWDKIVSLTNEQNQVVLRTNRAYMEVAAGMHYQKEGQWVESAEQIAPLQGGGAAATNGQHRVIFSSDAESAVAIDMQTPEGKRLQSRVLGLSYYDTASGSNVLIAEIKSSQGVILPPNRVFYEDAFTDFKAGVLYTYTRAGFEQDIILQERPPIPEVFGLNSGSSVLQVLTEFTAPPIPILKTNAIPSGAGGWLADQFLDFGAMKIGPGRAFMAGQNQLDGIPVAKEWLTLEGRPFLVEQVSVAAIADLLNQLPMPPQANVRPKAGSVLHVVSNKRLLPERKVAGNNMSPMRVARVSRPLQGFVLDYATLNATYTNYTFQGDTTYFISGTVTLYGTNTFEGGAVLKYTNDASLSVSISGFSSAAINWLAGAYRPVVFTGWNDDSIGDVINGSNGNPTNYYASPALSIVVPSTTPTVANFRIAHAKQALYLVNASPNFYHGQIVNCQNGVTSAGSSASFRNVLFANVLTNFNSVFGGDFTVQNGTFSGSDYLIAMPNSGAGLACSNSIFASVTKLTNSLASYTLAGGYNSFYNSPEFGSSQSTNNSWPFQTVGGGNYYLASESANRNAGTTNINSALLAELGGRTTYPPILYGPGTYTNYLEFIAQAQRDTDAVDLGYHYDPLDYLLGGIILSNAAIILNSGTAVGMLSTNNLGCGLALKTNAQFISEGRAENLNRLVAYDMVQEQTPAGWQRPGALVSSFLQISPTLIRCRFTDSSVPAGNDYHISVGEDIGPVNLENCQFHSGRFRIQGSTCNFTNCLLERVNTVMETDDAYVPVIRNNLIYGGTFDFFPLQTNAVIRDNLFDQAVVPDVIGGLGNTYDGGYNAYVTNYDRIFPAFTNDVILTSPPIYQTGILGRYYLPTNSPVINAGSTSASAVGLYHFTTATNQLKETNSIVDIGFHYVVADASGKAADKDGDGIADYLEDSNGNGAVDSGDTDWESATDMGLKVWITRPRHNSTIP